MSTLVSGVTVATGGLSTSEFEDLRRQHYPHMLTLSAEKFNDGAPWHFLTGAPSSVCERKKAEVYDWLREQYGQSASDQTELMNRHMRRSSDRRRELRRVRTYIAFSYLRRASRPRMWFATHAKWDSDWPRFFFKNPDEAVCFRMVWG